MTTRTTAREQFTKERRLYLLRNSAFRPFFSDIFLHTLQYPRQILKKCREQLGDIKWNQVMRGNFVEISYPQTARVMVC